MPVTINSNQVVLGLDVGHVRIGVARGLPSVGIASPLVTLSNGPTTLADIQKLIDLEQAQALVIGLPRNLNGDDTDQTRSIRSFIDDVTAACNIPVYMQDEALTSHHAEAELKRRGKPYTKGDIDALAASLIVEDFLRDPKGAIRG